MLRTVCFKTLNNFRCNNIFSIKRFSHTQLSKLQKNSKLLLFNQSNIKNFARSARSARFNTNSNGNVNKAIFEKGPIETGPIPSHNIAKAVIFSIVFSGGCFIGVSILEYEKLRSKYLERKASNFLWFKKNEKKKSEWRIEIEKWWNRLTPGEQVFVPIFLINAVVFGLWRIPSLSPYMIKYFCSNPAARAVCWPMFLSSFSHISLFHIFANMFVLHSFSNVAVSSLGKEQFLGLYLTAGTLSSLSSYIYKAATFQSGLSLGASGAIMSILAYVCTAYPDTQLGILFLPVFNFSVGTAIKGVMAFDALGCLLKWKFFDHAAHLGGAGLGIFWYFIGRENIWPQRHYFQRLWDEIRTPPKK